MGRAIAYICGATRIVLGSVDSLSYNPPQSTARAPARYVGGLFLRVIFILVSGLMLTGCSFIPRVTSGQIGCSEERIRVYDDSVGWSSRTWKAECDGKHYACSLHSGGLYTTAQVQCSPMAGVMKQDAGDGCQHDNQCKGNRICVQGECASP